MKMMLPDVIGHENQSTLSAPSMFMSRFIRTDFHADRFSYHTGSVIPDRFYYSPGGSGIYSSVL